MQVIVNTYPVDILTPHYRVYGELRTRGDPTLFLNDESNATLTVHDATLIPLRQDMRLGAVTMDELHIPKHEPQVLTVGDYTPQVRPLPKAVRLICFTDTYLLRGTFHMSPETRTNDVFYSRQSLFFAVTDLDTYSLYPLAVEVKARSALAYLRGGSVRAFYKAAEEGAPLPE